MASKQFSDLISSVVPSERHRTDIQQSWFGTLIGQATVAVGMVVAYLAAIGFLYQYVGESLERLHSSNPILFYGGIGLPLALVGVFSILPTLVRARRERKLRPLSDNSKPLEPGYFRLHPYEAADAKRFSRPDNALEQALAWLNGAQTPVLYLSGSSGSGKSSLVNAGLAPVLRGKGWAVLLVRGMGTPMAALTEALQAAAELYARPPSSGASLHTLLSLAGAERDSSGNGPLLIVMDQFEEFLILNEGVEKERYAEFLRDLAKNAIPNIVLLHVFRSDYRDLIFREQLPDYIDRDTAFSLSAFTRRNAQFFLHNGPVQLNSMGYDELFVGLDRIEDARGLYRPITLNMVGFVLERQGSNLAGDPGRLIDAYLRDCITHSDAKDFVVPVLEALISREGTKVPSEVGDIAQKTRLENWQIQATLSDLRRQGLVRSASDMWEISHDFLARIIGQITGRIKPSLISRLATPTLAAAAIGWLVAMGIGVPAWVQWQEADALRGVRALGFAQEPDEFGGLHFVARDTDGIDNQTLHDLSAYARNLRPIHVLDLTSADGITSLEGIAPLTGLISLDLSEINGITSLRGIEELTKLTSLKLFNADGIVSLDGIESLSALTLLDVSHTSGLTSLADIEGLSNLLELDLASTDAIISLETIGKLTNLESLNLLNADVIGSLDKIEGLTKLRGLELGGADGITSLAGIEKLKALEYLGLAYFGGTSLEGIEALTGLTSLDLTFADKITSLAEIAGLSDLRRLRLINHDWITGLESIEKLTALTLLDLSDADGITSLAGIERLKELKYLDLSGADGIISFDGINCEFLRGITNLFVNEAIWETCDA